MTIWLVRHGTTDWTQAGKLNGWTDVPLNEMGRAEAAALAADAGLPADAAIWSSDLQRATETALSLGAPREDARLRELDFGDLEGLTWAELEPETRRSLVDFDGFVAPAGESVAALGRRVEAFLSALEPGDHVVVTHGGVIRYLLRQTATDRHVAAGEAVRLVEP
ncbi:MAG TPA: histidine phosphatase family protein [Actinomycetota bacterium]|nr:histidine phosphatase family protein [Actinomycetota bacterium]